MRELVETLAPFFCSGIGKDPGTTSTERDELTSGLLCLISIGKALLVKVVCRFVHQQLLCDTCTQRIASVDPMSKVHHGRTDVLLKRKKCVNITALIPSFKKHICAF